jgi:hypothetical protein
MAKQILSEQFRRMQKLAGIITEEQLNENVVSEMVKFVSQNFDTIKANFLQSELEILDDIEAEEEDYSNLNSQMNVSSAEELINAINERTLGVDLEDDMDASELFDMIRELASGQLNEEANTDLELKSVAKKVFSVLKKYGLKPNYSDKGDVKLDKAYDSVVALVTDPDTNTGLIKVNIWAWAASNNKIDMGKLNSDITGVLGNEFENKSGKTTVGNDIVYNMLIRKKQ